MLLSLNIVNFAIIEDTVLDFDAGVTVFTGETGAGKSIIFDALAVLLGRRASVGMIRHGADYFRVEGVFSADDSLTEWMQSQGMETDGPDIVITRKMTSKGRSTCMINGAFATVKQLQELGSRLVILHEQNDNFSLMTSDFTRKMIDSSGDDIKKLSADYAASYARWAEHKKKLDDFNRHKQEHERRLDILQWEMQQLEEADIQDGEDEAIEQRLKVLEHGEKIHDCLEVSLHALTDEGGAQDQIAHAVKRMEEIAGYDKELGTMSENLSSAAYMIDDVISSMESYRADADFSEEELNSLQERDEQLLDLKRKYGPTLDDVKQYYASIKNEYESLHQMVFENESMKKELSEETERVLKQMKELENLRRKKGEAFCHEMTEVLHRLGMPHGRIALHIVPSEEPVSAGLKEMELYFSANPGEPLASMRDIASGGEISRIALAIEVITAPVLEARTLVFDEIDVGISGKAALACAKEILRLGKQVQVLCITHLPQTASIGSRYYHMEKVVENGKTHTTAVLLDHESHLRDVAQLISGSNSSEAALESARELEKRVLEK